MNAGRPKDCVFVLGMHRSGTSAMAGVLSLLGAHPGASLIAAHDAVNPKGFWEHADIVAVHERLLAALGSSWDDERRLPDLWWESEAAAEARGRLLEILRRDFSEAPLWVIKDPRLCRLLPLWLGILEQFGDCTPYFVHILRHPAEVARSLQNRDQIPEHSACLLWLEHLLEAERWSRGHPRMAISFTELLSDWPSAVARMIHEWHLPLAIDDPVRKHAVQQFLEPALRHHRASEANAASSFWMQLATDAYAIVCQHPPEQWATMLSPIAEQMDQIVPHIAPWTRHALQLRHELQQLQLDHGRLEREHAGLQQAITYIRNSWAWKLATPLRVAEHQLRRLWARYRRKRHD
ncbi:MAG: hypothetical protein N2Z69_09145 [Methylophilaceae bacterium]|nr:hypothetical protein [Methylophilaceae bacterium]